MEILTDNYIWVIIVVVIILMTIIGYIAEKTNFGKKEFSKKKPNKKAEKPSLEVKQEKETLEASAPVVKAPEIEKTVETTIAPEESVKQEVKKPEEPIQFADPLMDDMNVSSNVSAPSYEEPISQEEVVLPTEDLNAPFGEKASYDIPNESTSNVEEDLNAPFGDFEFPSEDKTGENLNDSLSDTLYSSANNMPEEDLNAPFGDNAEIPSREEFNLNLPDIDSIKEDVSTSTNSENDDDDIWKF